MIQKERRKRRDIHQKNRISKKRLDMLCLHFKEDYGRSFLRIPPNCPAFPELSLFKG
jgi:hypothetical protein